MSKIIIGLSGVKGAGKSTAAEALLEVLRDAQELSLAGKLKQVCADVFNVPHNFFTDPALKEVQFADPVQLTRSNTFEVLKHFDIEPFFAASATSHLGKWLHTPRALLQYVGTEVLRAIDSEIHCKACIAGAKASIGVVTDIRFPNEFDFFRNAADVFLPIYVSNPAAESVVDGHASESYGQYLRDASTVVVNDGTLDDFKAKVIDLVIGKLSGVLSNEDLWAVQRDEAF